MAYCRISSVSLCLLLSVIILLATTSAAIASSSKSSARGKSSRQQESNKTKPKVNDDLPKNFYTRLGVSPKASEKDIKKAYRKLAMKVSQCYYYLHSAVLIVFL